MGSTEIDKLIQLSRILRYKMWMVARAIHKMIKIRIRGLTDNELLGAEKDLWRASFEVVKSRGPMTPTKLQEELKGHLLHKSLIQERIRRDIEEERRSDLYYAPFHNLSLDEIKEFFIWKSVNHLGSTDHSLEEFILIWRKDKRRSLKVISNEDRERGDDSGRMASMVIQPPSLSIQNEETKAYGPKRKNSNSKAGNRD